MYSLQTFPIARVYESINWDCFISFIILGGRVKVFYVMAKKSCPGFIVYYACKNGQNFLDIQNKISYFAFTCTRQLFTSTDGTRPVVSSYKVQRIYKVGASFYA